MFTFANVAAGVETAALEPALAQFPQADLQTRSAFVADREGEIDTLLNLLYVLLALAIVVSLFGMVNTLVLSIFERTREIGMLRAVGITRRQTRRMIRQESVITGLIGAALGVPLGVGLAAMVTGALSSTGVVFAVPVVTLLVFLIAARGAGWLASVLPAAPDGAARRARGTAVRVTDARVGRGREAAPEPAISSRMPKAPARRELFTPSQQVIKHSVLKSC